ncbi:MAG: DEAD/DEAH box helicase [Acinetobacter sp.]|nr:MAG: DEAD/DEAH box helicase [Acinetobacter sp.]
MLAEKLYQLKSFRSQYDAIMVLSVCSTIPELTWETDRIILLQEIDWNNLLGIASALSYSDDHRHLDAALRIAQTALTEEATNQVQREAAGAVLMSLTNKPAIKLAIDRNRIARNFAENLPLPLRFQAMKSDYENSIVLADRVIALNRFQTKVHNSYLSHDAISISAPTSAGKSFILCSLIIEELLKSTKNIIYLVPTRALISQVEADLSRLLVEYGLSKVNITTVPQYDNSGFGSNIFIFTQERLHWFLIDQTSFPIDVVIVDEAHKIEDSYRGILLQQKLEEVISSNPNVKIFFSSPFTSNPEILLENAPEGASREPVNTQFVSVNQNLIYCSQFPGISQLWQLDLVTVEKSMRLGTIRLADRPITETKKMSFIPISFSANSNGNVIYANGPAESEEISLMLFDSLPTEQVGKKLNDLIDLVKKTIHADYRLAKVLEKRIAFHYGNMPLLIREEIENLFKFGEIKYLICTSTLLEGVNLPAKSIYIRKPKRGKSTDLSPSDFWNLAGRAGRWGKEFSGNIICIEPTKWNIPPDPNKHKQRISRALDIIDANRQELIDYINDGTPRLVAESRQDLEFAFGYYYSRFLNGKLGDSSMENEMTEVFSGISDSISIPSEIIRRNPGISPIAQQSLLDYFVQRLAEIETLIPVYPEDNNAYEEYTNLVGRIGMTISAYPYQLNASRSILLMNWMSGKPLSYIIRATFRSYQKNEKYKHKTIHIVIREVMDNVENFARFRFAK